MFGEDSPGFSVRHLPSILSAGWFRLTLLLVMLGFVVLAVLPKLSEWMNPSKIVVLHQNSPSHGEALSDGPVVSSSPLPSDTLSVRAPTSASASEGDRPPSPGDASTGASSSVSSSLPPVTQAGKEAEGRFRIQVGAFLDRHHADRLESRLKTDNLPVRRITIPRTLILYQLRVDANGRASDLAKRLRDLGLTLGAPQGDGGGPLLVDPPLPLKRAVDLSKRLKEDGVEVELRRIDRQATVYAVQVGEYPSQSAALEAQGDLRQRGYDGVLVRE